MERTRRWRTFRSAFIFSLVESVPPEVTYYLLLLIQNLSCEKLSIVAFLRQRVSQYISYINIWKKYKYKFSFAYSYCKYYILVYRFIRIKTTNQRHIKNTIQKCKRFECSEPKTASRLYIIIIIIILYKHVVYYYLLLFW